MTFWQLWAFLAAPICVILCAALALLFVFHVRQDRLSRSFAAVITCLTVMGLMGFGTTILSRLDRDVTLTVELAFAALITLPLFLTVFTLEYLNAWTQFRRKLVLASVCLLSYGVFALLMQWFIYDVRMDNEGNLSFSSNDPLSLTLLIIWLIYSAYPVYLIIREFRSRSLNPQIAVGIITIVAGSLSVGVPELIKNSIGPVVLSIGALMIAQPVLRQRLFDPLVRLNNQLEHRAAQLDAIMQVAHKANALLSLEPLLKAVTQEMQQAFGYRAVALYLRSDAGNSTLRASGGDIAATAQLPAVLYSSNHVISQQLGEIRQFVVPLIYGTSTPDQEIVRGALLVQSAADEQTAEVLQILAAQIMTAIHNAELFEETRQAHRAADRANSLKTRFLEYISHEIRTPLQTMLPISHDLQHADEYEGVTLTTSYIDDLKKLERSGKHLNTLINRSLDLAKIEAGKFELVIEAINPIDVLDAVLQQTESLRKPTVQMCAEYPATLPSLRGDLMAIQQIFLNVVGNACKFCEAGRITLNAQVEGDMLLFTVSDTGPGIPDEVRSVLFNRFEQVSKLARWHGGSGLGLHISRELVHLHGGKIDYASEVGKGTTFYFTLPIAPDGAKQSLGEIEQLQAPQVRLFTKNEAFPIQAMVLDLDTRLDDEQTEIQIDGLDLVHITKYENAVRFLALAEPLLMIDISDSTSNMGLNIPAATTILHFNMDTDWREWLLKQRNDMRRVEEQW
jgi:signal transduction histidine kinase